MTSQLTLIEPADTWPHNTAVGRHMVANGWTWQIMSSRSGLTHHGVWVKTINGRQVTQGHEEATAAFRAGAPPF